MFTPIGSHVNENENKSCKIINSKFQKSKNTFVLQLRRNFRKSLKRLKSNLREE